ncbi:hypothetical protein [Reichenbachiella sp. MALMAid0571]|uniref:hypothetical protein n=1 Tax=Reichenbachiella sp. MALMAid0571 TaxID=3143939 RepID=UPI0032DEDFB8
MILNTPIEVTISKREIIVKRPFVFQTRKYPLRGIRGYSFGSTTMYKKLAGIVKIYHENENFMLRSVQVDNLKNIVEQLDYLGIKFLGHEERVFNWNLKGWGQYKYLYDTQGYLYKQNDEDSINTLVLNKPSTPYFLFTVIAITTYMLFLAFPVFDLRERYINYHFDQFPSETVGSFYRCIPVKNKKGGITEKRKAYYKFFVDGERYTDTRTFKKGCPPKGSKAVILYSYKNPSISKFIKPIGNKSTKKPSQ